MLLLSCITIMLPFSMVTSDAVYRKGNPGPPCYGRSDCTKPLNEEHLSSDKESVFNGPKRYLRDDRFRSPVFGSYKFNPLMGEFEISNHTEPFEGFKISTYDTAKRATEQSTVMTVMRAFDAETAINKTSSGGRRNNNLYYDSD